MNTVQEKKGYKWTEEFGYIPEDWEIKKLSEYYPFIRNGFVGIATPYYTNDDDGIFYLQSNNIHKGKINENSKIYVTKEFHNRHIKNSLKEDDILMVQSGHSGECAVVGKKYVGCNCHALIIMSSNQRGDSNYVSYFLNSEIGQDSLKNLLIGNTIKHILASEVKEQVFVCPPLPEQQKIASVLSDVDSLIDKTKELINKKKELKIATMQKLLKPKEGWKEKIFKDIAEMSSGGTPLSTNSFFYNGSIPFLSINDLTTQGKYLRKTEKTITELGLNNSSARIVKKGDLLYAMYATLGKCSIACFDVAISQAVLGISVNKKIMDNIFLYYYLIFIENDVKKIGQTGTQSNLSKEIVSNFVIPCPPLFEQHQIATILSDMDSEIESLEKELEKYKDLKSGMMQQLLTGKVRLV